MVKSPGKVKEEGINNNWNELVRIAKSQKIVTTTAQNQEDTTIIIKKYSEPIESLTKLYEALKYKHFQFKKSKSVVHKTEFKNQEVHYLLDISPH